MRHLRWIATAAGFALMGVLLAVALNQGSDNATSINDARDTNRLLEKKLDEQETITAALLEQIRILGQQPVVDPKDPPAPGRLIAIPGPRGASCIEELGYPRCRGDKGEPSKVPGPGGTPGQDGKDSTVPGPRGPGCVEEVGLEKCKGDKGDPSTVPGPAGRGIQSTFCGDDGRWDITYTDGSTEDGGVCRIVSLPQPPPNGDQKP